MKNVFESIKAKHRGNIFAEDASKLCEAEIYYLIRCHEPINFEESEFLKSLKSPIVDKMLDLEGNYRWIIFADGSLYDSTTSECWRSASDFMEECYCAIQNPKYATQLTLAERNFFGVEIADEEASWFQVCIEYSFHSPTSQKWAENGRYEPIMFVDRAEAEEWIRANATPDNEVYRLSHGEYARPKYHVLACH